MPSTNYNSRTRYDVIVVGSGHAGCEAALASARIGCRTLMLTANLDRIGYMACNPSIGGPGKSQIVAEVDALGGVMGRAADHTVMQVRRLNTSKGPAVHAIRAQCDKSLYALIMKQFLESQTNLEIVQDEALGLLTSGQSSLEVTGVEARLLGRVSATAVVITAGTFLRARMIAGDDRSQGGRAGDGADTRLSGSLADLGLRLRRFKTGTPPRLDVRSIDVDKTEAQWGEDVPLWLSRDGREGRIAPVTLPSPSAGPFSRSRFLGGRLQVPCYQTWTNEAAHEIIRRNLDRAPMYNGSIHGTGPRYCPSIEDKVGRFVDKPSHPVFIEPEGWMSGEAYIQGMSTSLPVDVQAEVIQRIPGLERGRITRFGYAVEYDALDATELTHALEYRRIGGLFFAGQVNGTSGYEEAAGQGIIAGANAAARARSLPLCSIGRSDGYIGVMIDDLVSLALDEPYRMLTSRAEYRLLLRSDTADHRMLPEALRLGLISNERAEEISAESDIVASTLQRLPTLWFGSNPTHSAALEAERIQPVSRSQTALEIARRPDVSLHSVLSACSALGQWKAAHPTGRALERAEIAVKYGSFIVKEEREVARQTESGSQLIPPDVDFAHVAGLRVEARQKLAAARPHTVERARRTAGVTPTDIGALLIHLKADVRQRRQEKEIAATL